MKRIYKSECHFYRISEKQNPFCEFGRNYCLFCPYYIKHMSELDGGEHIRLVHQSVYGRRAFVLSILAFILSVITAVFSYLMNREFKPEVQENDRGSPDPLE